MNIQTPNARNTDPVTSHMAGEAITKSGARQNQITLVENLVTIMPACTSAELARHFDLDRHMIARRLPDAMHVKKAEIRICTVSNRKAVTWVMA